MAETTNKTQKGPAAKESIKVEKGAIEVEGEEHTDFTPDELARMLKVKQEIARGRYTDITPEHRKLLFVQWLIDNHKLNS